MKSVYIVQFKDDVKVFDTPEFAIIHVQKSYAGDVFYFDSKKWTLEEMVDTLDAGRPLKMAMHTVSKKRVS